MDVITWIVLSIIAAKLAKARFSNDSFVVAVDLLGSLAIGCTISGLEIVMYSLGVSYTFIILPLLMIPFGIFVVCFAPMFLLGAVCPESK